MKMNQSVMKKRQNLLLKRVAALLAMAMLMTFFFNDLALVVSAAPVETYTVNLPSGIAGSVQVTLTNNVNAADTLTVTPVGNQATFEGFVDDEKTYTLSVTGMTYYEDYELETFTVDSDGTSILLSELTRRTTTVTGKLLIDDGITAYNGDATVIYSGVDSASGSVEVDVTDGSFSLQLDLGRTYTINIDPTVDDYETLTIDSVVITSNLDIGERILSRKTFEITIGDGENGSITLDPENNPVPYGEDVTVSIEANEGYRIETLNIDGASVTEAVGLLSYEYTIEEVIASHSIEATFKLQPNTVKSSFKVQIFLSQNNWSIVSELKDGIKVTLTDSENDMYTQTVNFNKNNNEAVFANFVDSNRSYYLKITSNIGFEDYLPTNPIQFSNSSHNVYRDNDLEALTRKTVDFHFKDADENNISVAGSYSTSGYDSRGPIYFYSRSSIPVDDLFAGQTYTVSVNANGYESWSQEITVNSGDNAPVDVELELKTYTVSKEVTQGEGDILFLGDDLGKESVTVNHFNNRWITVGINPAENFEIDKVYLTELGKPQVEVNAYYVDGQARYSIYNAQADYTISVTFKPITHTVKFNFSDSIVEIVPETSENITLLPDGKSYKVNQGYAPRFNVKIKDDSTQYHLSRIFEETNESNVVLESDQNDTHEQVIVINPTDGLGVTRDYTYRVDVALDQYEVWIFQNIDGVAPIPTPTPELYEHGTTIEAIKSPEEGLFVDTNTDVSVRNNADVELYTVKIDTNGDLTVPIDIESDLKIVMGLTRSVASNADPTTLFTLTPNNTSLTATRKNGKVNEYIYINTGESASVRFAPFSEGNIDIPSIFDRSEDSFTFWSSTYIPEFYVQFGEQRWIHVTNYPIQIIIDKQAPSVESISTPNWSSAESIITGTASDPTNQGPSSGLWKVVWSKDGPLSSRDVLNEISEGINCADIDTEGNFTFSISGQQDRDYYVYAVDQSQNVSSSRSVNVRIDSTIPTIEAFYINATQADQSIRVLPYGTYTNQAVQLRVAASDAGGSGLDSITLYLDNAIFEEKSVSSGDNSVTFTIPEIYIAENYSREMTITAIAKDNAGNEIEIPVFPDNAVDSFTVNKLILDNIMPTAVISPTDSLFTDASGKTWYSERPTFNIDLRDADSGINNVTITVNGTVVNTDAEGNDINLRSDTMETTEQSIQVVADAALRRPDGTYEIVVRIEDNAGNISEATKVVYQDIADPYIQGFRFEVAGADGVDAMPAQIESTDYGYFFPEDTVVTIQVGDSAPSAGVHSVTYYTVDANNGKSTEVTLLTENDEISFIVPANFKGKIFAKATDKLGNTPELFTSPVGAIVESPSKHLEETHITIEKPQTTLRDNKGFDLYANDIDVNLTVLDTYSGIYKVEWSVVAPNDAEKNQSGQVEINNDASFAGGESSGWAVSGTDENLVTEITRTLRITNNSNAILLRVRMTDRAGNVTEKEMTFSIDKTAPTIQVSYNNNSPDSQFSDYYNADRTATIVITERNFSAEKVPVTITGTGVSTPSVSSWTTVTDLTNPDKTTHTATVHYNTDGDYTFDIACSDLAGNRANIFTQQSFTIDKTKPIVSVSYDNDSALNGKYYQAMRTATIRIVDKNFEPSRVKIEGVATDNGASITFPVTSGWSSSGDTHTTTVRFSADATYRFAISGQDRSGNSLDEYRQSDFIIDTTAPTLLITGVENRSANSGDVIPVVSMSDVNYDSSSVAITLIGSNSGEAVPTGKMEAQSDGEIFTFDDFQRIKEVDDLYTLTVTLVDFAGNETTQQIEFSVNRFGSVYTFDDSMNAIKGQYLLSEPEIILHETNVDALLSDTIKIKITVNGVPRDLVEGADYSVQFKGGDGEWSQYTYTIYKELFAGDGLYSVILYSVDRAGNVNENIDEVKAAEINFGVDKTRPVVVSVDLDSNKQYPVEEKSATFSIKDNLELASVRVYLNGEEVALQIDGDNYTFVIAESNAPQSIKVIAVDAAGNEQVIEIENVLITTNLFYRWYNNTPVFVGSILGVVGMATGISLFFVFFRRKRRRRA